MALLRINEYYVTFGVQFGRRASDDQHPLGMYTDGYCVIEAPDEDVARRIAHALFREQWAMIYSSVPERQFNQAGELMRIKWIQKEQQ